MNTNNFEVDYPWLILDDTISESDFKLWSDNKIDIPQNSNTIKHFYNQSLLNDDNNVYKDTRYSCWLFGSMWCISDLTWYKFTEENILEIHKSAIDFYWLVVPWWMKMSDAVDCVRNWWNEKFPSKKITSFRLEIGDNNFMDAMNKKHSLAVWYRTSEEYRKDIMEDWIVDWEDFPKWWWHLVRANFPKTEVKIDDNYYETKIWNTYTNNKLLKLKENGVFFTSAYLFLLDKTIEEQIKDNIVLESAKKMFDLWYWNWLNPNWNMTRQEVMTVLYRILEQNWLL